MRRMLKRVWRPIGEFIFGCLIIVYFVFKFALIWLAAVIMIPFHLIGFAWMFLSWVFGFEFEMWEPVPSALTDRFEGFGSWLGDRTERILGIADGHHAVSTFSDQRIGD